MASLLGLPLVITRLAENRGQGEGGMRSWEAFSISLANGSVILCKFLNLSGLQSFCQK